MLELISPTPALVFTSVLYVPDREEHLKLFFEKNWGEAEFIIVSEQSMLGHYSAEMGHFLKRCFFFSKKTWPREELINFKLHCLEREKQTALNIDGKFLRQENWDPGLICLEHVVLSTTKPYTHRPYLSNNIYVELTYLFKTKPAKSYYPLEWTYPDYKKEEIIKIFNSMRSNFLIAGSATTSRT